MSQPDRKPSRAAKLIATAIFVCLLVGLAAAMVLPNFVGSGPAPRNACINNLRQIDGAIQQWALENKRKPEANVSANNIAPYLKFKLACPQGGKYAIGPAVSNAPTCSIPSHVLPPQ